MLNKQFFLFKITFFSLCRLIRRIFIYEKEAPIREGDIAR